MVRKVIVIIGTRPEAIKLIPVYLKLVESELFEPILLSTGQHKNMLDQIFNTYNIKPDFDLEVMNKVSSLSTLTGHLFLKLDTFIEQHTPDIVIVQGDTTSAMVGAMVGYYRKVMVAHVEAGLRTYDKFSPFPEEINRQVIGKVADIHLAPTKIAADNLSNEGISNIHIVGNTVIDSLLFIKNLIYSNEQHYLSKFNNIDLAEKDLVLVTTHRRENHGEGLKNICSAIIKLANKYPNTIWVFPVHLNPNVNSAVHDTLGNYSNIYLLPPLQYDDLIFFMSKSKIILSDSGGIQEEAPTFNVPIIVLRETTERPEGIQAGCAQLAGTNEEAIIASFDSIYTDLAIYNKMASVPNPYGDGYSADRIVSILKTSINTLN